MKIIIVGASPKKTFFERYHINPSDLYIGLDAGSIEIIKKGINPDFSIGDFDSTNEFDYINKYSLKTITYPSMKSETDLELALKLLGTLKGANNLNIDIYDVTGGRLDQEFNAYMLLAKYDMYKLRIIDDSNEVIYIKEGDLHIIKNENCQYFSIIPKKDSVVSIRNAKYPLDKAQLTLNDTYTISNELLESKVPPIIEVHSGGIYLFIYTNK